MKTITLLMIGLFACIAIGCRSKWEKAGDKTQDAAESTKDAVKDSFKDATN